MTNLIDSRAVQPDAPVREAARKHKALVTRPATKRVRLMLLHPRVLFRTSLARLLDCERDFHLVAECANTVEAVEKITSTRPDVLLFDFAVWHDLVPAAFASGFRGRLLGIAETLDPNHCARAISQGISGVFIASDSPENLVYAIHVVMNGGAWLNQTTARLLADRYPYHEDLCLDNLTERDQAVLRGILAGSTNREIAGQIGVSEATVKLTLQHLFDKTGVRTRSQLVRILLEDSPAKSNLGHAV